MKQILHKSVKWFFVSCYLWSQCFSYTVPTHLLRDVISNPLLMHNGLLLGSNVATFHIQSQETIKRETCTYWGPCSEFKCHDLAPESHCNGLCIPARPAHQLCCSKK